MAARQGSLISAQAFSSTDAISTDVLLASRLSAPKAVVFIYSTQAGTAIVYYQDYAGNDRALTTAQTVDANDLTVLNFDYPVPRLKVIFTPDAATAGVLTIEAYNE